jgi:signal transduction histidine kinase
LGGAKGEAVEQVRILIAGDDREFVNSLVRSWQGLRYSPEFAVAGTEAAGEFAGYAVVLCDGVAALPHLAAGVVLAIAITGGEALPKAEGGLRVVSIPRRDGWADHAAALAQETVLRLESQAQVAEVKQRLRESEHFAALGRFITEARHGLGNALTGVMGHSELLLLENGAGLRIEARAQLETIHAMSLKMNETLHRLSSLDMELRIAERQAERESHYRAAQ